VSLAIGNIGIEVHLGPMKPVFRAGTSLPHDALQSN